MALLLCAPKPSTPANPSHHTNHPTNGMVQITPFFCTASKTAHNMAQQLLHAPVGSLPPHPLEYLCTPPTLNLPSLSHTNAAQLVQVLEVFVDDFIAMLHTPTPATMQHATCAILHGIHSIFPAGTNNPQNDSISVKKLKQGDRMWDTQKELLGWLFDGITQCIILPENKATAICKLIWDMTKGMHTPYKQLEKLNGKLIHVSISIPKG